MRWRLSNGPIQNSPLTDYEVECSLAGMSFEKRLKAIDGVLECDLEALEHLKQSRLNTSQTPTYSIGIRIVLSANHRQGMP